MQKYAIKHATLIYSAAHNGVIHPVMLKGYTPQFRLYRLMVYFVTSPSPSARYSFTEIEGAAFCTQYHTGLEVRVAPNPDHKSLWVYCKLPSPIVSHHITKLSTNYG